MSEFDWERAEADLTGQAVTATDGAGVARVDSAPDSQRGVAGGARDGGVRRAVVPVWMQSRSEIRTAAGWAAGYACHAAAYHALRTPVYAGRLLMRSPRGLARVSVGGVRWVLDLEGAPVRQAAVRVADPDAYLRLAKQRDRRVRARVSLAVMAGLAVLVAVLVAASAPEPARWLMAAVVVGVLGAAGRVADRPILDTAVVAPRVAKLTSDTVTRSLSVLGLAGINQAVAKDGRAIGFVAPITRDGPGWRADVDLPAGVTAAEVIERRDKLAAGLGRPLGAVWPEPAPDVHPGRLTLWVGDQDMATAKPAVWPLAKTGTVDLFKPVPFGTDPRGRRVDLDLIGTNMLIGALPGAGKTFALRVPLLAAALDVRAELWTFELKGTGDLEPLAKVSARYASGPDDDTVEAALQALRDLRKECARRAKVIASLPKNDCPENKVTPQLAGRKALGLHPLVVDIDECQELFTHPEHGKEAGELAEKVIKLGRALGVILLLATQRPDRGSLPTGISANVGTRFCLRVMGQVENDMILGTSAYKNGIRATLFGPKDRGVGYLVGAGDDAQITRTYYLDGPAAERITTRARALRQAAGTLTGHAAGDTTPTATERADTLLEDVTAVCPPERGNGKYWTDTILAKLAAYRPDTYNDMSRDQLTAALRRHGIGTGQVWSTDETTGRGANRRGIDTRDIAAVLTDRNRKNT